MLYYSQSWEDTYLLRSIVDTHEVEHYHMVASGGDHAFSLLRHGVTHIHLIDTEHTQIGHVQKKLAALSASNRDELFGVSSRRGLLHGGKLEGFLQKFSRVFPILLAPGARKQMVQADSTAHRAEVYAHKWDTRRFQFLTSRIFSLENVDTKARPLGLIQDKSKKPRQVNYLDQFKEKILAHRLIENPYVDYIIHGYHKHSRLDYLQGNWIPESDALLFHQMDMKSYVRELPRARHMIHASDIMEGTDEEYNDDFFAVVDKACTPGSLFLYWEHRYAITVPHSFQNQWTLVKVTENDRVPFYNNFYLWKKQSKD
ncbi:MAG: BtaA family protein [Schleiferiaceae bacterium]|nr:BtaA family protein [Schleiferiaceae bacterium]